MNRFQPLFSNCSCGRTARGRCPWPDQFQAGSTTMTLQLLGAGVDHPMALQPSHLAALRSATMWRRFTAKGQLLGKGPTLTVKLALLTFRQSELVNKLPRTIVCPAVMAGPPLNPARPASPHVQERS